LCWPRSCSGGRIAVRVTAARPPAGPQPLRAVARLSGRLVVQAVEARLAALDCSRPAHVPATTSPCSCARARRPCGQHTPKFPLLKERSSECAKLRQRRTVVRKSERQSPFCLLHTHESRVSPNQCQLGRIVSASSLPVTCQVAAKALRTTRQSC